MEYSIVTARQQGELKEKCPVCRNVNRNMLRIGNVEDGLCGCFECGCVFIGKQKRALLRMTPTALVAFIPQGQQNEPIPDEPQAGLTCSVCGKECKNALGLNSHMRTHESTA